MKTLQTWIFLLGAIFAAPDATPAEFRLGLFYGKEIRACVFSVTQGEYMLVADGKTIAVARMGNMFHIALNGDLLEIRDTLQSYGAFHSVHCKGVSENNVFQVRPVSPPQPAKESDDDLVLTATDFTISLVNYIDLEKYLAGTVESEGGAGAGIEFYKAQAILARTYAVKNFTRHAPQGFNLCDGVHCQAYNGKSRMNPLIYEAALSTKDLVLATKDSTAVTIAYHGNCGGLTSSASMAWNDDLPYLVSVPDPFCTGSAQHEWRKTITLTAWNDYLAKKGIIGSQPTDFILTDGARAKYTGPENNPLALATIRNDLNLRSSFFTLEPAGDNMIIHGYGSGHGVGLCQDGAIQMARVGYTYIDILMYYFHNLIIISRP